MPRSHGSGNFAAAGVMTLTLDHAVALALKSNTELVVRQAQERSVHGQVLTVGNALVPICPDSG